MEKVKIIFQNGTEIEAERNGSCYIVENKPVFPADLSVVTVQNTEGEEVFKNVKVQECASVDGRYWFTFVEVPEIEAWKASIEDALCELSMG